MFGKAVAAVVPVANCLSGIPCRMGGIVCPPIGTASGANPDFLLDAAAAHCDKSAPRAVSPGVFQHSTPHFTGRQRPENIVTQSGDNHCANVVRNTRTAAAIVQPAA